MPARCLQSPAPAPSRNCTPKLHATPGFGVRGVASPFVVGYVDIGFAHGKAAVFSGIDYPF